MCPIFATEKTAPAGQGRGTAKLVSQSPAVLAATRATAKDKPGSDPGQHIMEVDVPLEELAAILGDELELPRIEPKGRANISQEKSKYDSIRRSGPESLRHRKRTYFQALPPANHHGQLRSGRTGHHADSRGQALPVMDHSATASSERCNHLHDGRLRLE